MVAKAEGYGLNISWLTALISFLTCLLLLFLILELTSRLVSYDASFHSVTVPIESTAEEFAIEADTLEETVDAPVEQSSASPFAKNKKSPPAISQKVRAVYALVVLDYGLSSSQSKLIAEKLPEYTTVSLSPYALNKQESLSLIEQKNMELWGFVETSTSGGYNQTSGPLNISSTLTSEVKKERIERLLSSSDNLTGFILNNDNLDIGSAFTTKGYGYYNLGDQAIPTLIYNRYNQVLMDKTRLKIFLNDVFERSNGIIAIEPSPSLVDALPDLLKSFEQAGLQIVPLSYFIEQQ